MTKNTDEAYKEAIKKQYEIAKNGINYSFLINPSPAKLRDLCVQIFNNIITSKSPQSDDDLIAFKNFWGFEFKAEEVGKINREIDRLKPIGRFYEGKSIPVDWSTIEMAAILVDFPDRPFKRFPPPPPPQPPRSWPERLIKIFNEKIVQWLKQFLTNKMYLTMGTVVVMVVLVWSLNKTVFTPKNCMIWAGDHYQEVDCGDPEVSGATIHFSEELLEKFRKVPYSDTLTFFDAYGKPLIWYSKQNGQYELFTYHGLHPVTEKTLKPITQTIIANLRNAPNQ